MMMITSVVLTYGRRWAPCLCSCQRRKSP